MSFPARFFKRMILVFGALFAGVCEALPPFNLPYGVTPTSHTLYRLHMLTFYICCGIGVVVFSVLIYALVKYRRSRGAEAKDIHEHLWLEILWTTIPFILLIIMAVPATRALIEIHNTDAPDVNIKVTGYQWKWKYDYLDQGVSFFSNLSTPQADIDANSPKNENFLLEVDHEVVVPVHKKIRFLLTSSDVIHSWWVPELGLKQDAIPGYINEAWTKIDTPGVYRGQCAELCGAYHGFMPIVVRAVSQKEFDQWVSAQTGQQAAATQDADHDLKKDELMEIGQKAYEMNCSICHQGNGEGVKPTFPALKGGAVVVGPVDAQIALVLNGVKGTAMQAFGSQLDDKTLAAIITYTRNAWGNDVLNQKNKQPTVVQPSEIKAAR